MIEFLTANLAEILVSVLLFVMSGVWGVLASFKSRFQSDMSNRKKQWDEELIKIHHNFDHLMSDHKDIMRDLDSIKTELGEKVEKIMVDHAGALQIST